MLLLLMLLLMRTGGCQCISMIDVDGSILDRHHIVLMLVLVLVLLMLLLLLVGVVLSRLMRRRALRYLLLVPSAEILSDRIMHLCRRSSSPVHGLTRRSWR